MDSNEIEKTELQNLKVIRVTSDHLFYLKKGGKNANQWFS